MSDGAQYKWCRKFKYGRTALFMETRTFATEDIVQQRKGTSRLQKAFYFEIPTM